MRLGLSHLADHKFRDKLQDSVNPMCIWGQEIKTSTHFLFHCPNYDCTSQAFFEKVNKIDTTTVKQNKKLITKLFFFDN